MRKNKVIKILIVLILIFLTIYIQGSSVYAGLLDNSRNESGPAPEPPTPSDTPVTPVTPSTPTPSGPQTITIQHYTSISGNVAEHLGQVEIEQGGQDSGNYYTGIRGVTVNLKQGNRVVASQVTESNGTYSFSPAPGTYSLEFVYGKLSESDLNNTELVKEILKYNGHDYITVKTPEGGNFKNVYEYEIIQSGKGAAQVYLAVDCSAVMRSTMVTVNGETKSRLEVATDSAKKLINKLLDSGENIYIGLVFFSGTNYRAVSLTKNKELLYSALDDIVSNGWQTHNTNIVGALNKVKESYYNNDRNNSNRYVAILSDGIPTSDGRIETYYDMTDSELMSTLTTIKETTKEKVKELKDDGIKIFSLIVKGDEDENKWSEEIFGKPNSDIFISSKDGDEMVETITEDLMEYIKTTTDKREYTSGSEVIAGYEDSTRRREVDSNFETFTYNNTVMFEQIQKYSASEYDKQKSQELSDKTWMKVSGGENYVIDSVPTPSTEYEYDDEGEITRIIQHVATGYSNQNLILAQRPAISLVTTTTATGLKIILADGQTLTVQSRPVESDLPLQQSIDLELAHGANIQIEYTIKIKNDSSIQCNYLELINYLPENFMFSQNTKLITEEGKNASYGWIEIPSLQTLKDSGHISDNTLTQYGKRKTLRIVLDNAGQGEDGFYIPPGGEYEIKVVASRVISSLYDLNTALIDATEVLVYKDSANRRMAYLQEHDYGTYNLAWLIGVYPGDSKDRDCSNCTNLVFIIPPTGIPVYLIKIVATTSIILATVLIFILIIKLSKRKKQNR